MRERLLEEIESLRQSEQFPLVQPEQYSLKFSLVPSQRLRFFHHI
jgi:hypothetical protein